MADPVCRHCGGPTLRLTQTGQLRCARECRETPDHAATRRELEGFTADLARLVGQHVPKGYGFTLLVFGYGQEKSLAYCSSAQRPDMVHTLREILDRLEATKGKAS